MPSKATRVALLLAVLAVTALWALDRLRARRARTTWEQPVALAVLVVEGAGPATGPDQLEALRAALAEVAGRLSEERRRHAPGARGPAFTVELFGPLRPARLPPHALPGPGAVERARHALDLWLAARAAHAEVPGGFDPAAYDVRIYLLATPPGASPFAEGLGEAGGELGVVRASLDGGALLAATAAFHEAFHALGATDKYDRAGHAVAPGGLAEPERRPPYPQRLAELMVGEVPLAPGEGRLPVRADELGVGPATAAEVGWTGRE